MEPFDVLIVSIQSQGNPAIEKIFCQTKMTSLAKEELQGRKKTLA